MRGIGAWTVEMFLIFRLGRPDVLPIHDLGVKKGWSITYGKKHMPKPKELLAFGERWRPYRTVASWYMWRACQQAGNAAIAHRLGVSLKTVRNNVSNIFTKLQVNDRSTAIVKARDAGYGTHSP